MGLGFCSCCRGSRQDPDGREQPRPGLNWLWEGDLVLGDLCLWGRVCVWPAACGFMKSDVRVFKAHPVIVPLGWKLNWCCRAAGRSCKANVLICKSQDDPYVHLSLLLLSLCGEKLQIWNCVIDAHNRIPSISAPETWNRADETKFFCFLDSLVSIGASMKAPTVSRTWGQRHTRKTVVGCFSSVKLCCSRVSVQTSLW